jgi:predicted SAM-dependent methyltransferase
MVHIARRASRRLGLDVVRYAAPSVPSDLELYEALYSPESLDERRFYNVGSGGFQHRYWTAVDHPSDWYAEVQSGQLDLVWDLEDDTALAVDDGRAEAVYTSHTVEHVSDKAAAKLFREAYRILKPGGTLRVTTPNIDLYHRAWRDGDRRFFYWSDMYSTPGAWEVVGMRQPMCDASLDQLFLFEFATTASTHFADGGPNQIADEELRMIFDQKPYEQALDHCVARVDDEKHRKCPGGHRNWWTYTKAERMIRTAGFENVRLSAYGQSFCPVLRDTALFDNTHPKISLYVEATR